MSMIATTALYTKLLSKKKLSICMISDDFLPAMTGVGVHLKLIAPALARRGHQVSVITTRRKGEAAIEHWEGVTIYRVFTVKMYGFYQALPTSGKIREIFNHVNPDLIHHHYAGFMMGIVCKVAEELQIRQVSTYHFTAEVLTQPLPLRPLRGLIRRLMVGYNNRFDLVMAPSQVLAKQIKTEGVKSNIQYITNPVVFQSNEKVVPAVRNAGFTILFAGRLGQEKNIGYLLKSFADLLKKKPDANLWIAGRGPEEKKLKDICEELKITQQVKFLGFLDHPTLAKYYAACDIFVLPSLLETQGLVAMEAMWFGKPIIVTNKIVSATELVEQGVNGYIVDASSVADLTMRMETLADNPELREKMGIAGLNRTKDYQPELVVKAIEESYTNVLNLGNKTHHFKELPHSEYQLI